MRIFSLGLALCLTVSAALAAPQSKRTAPNGTISFDAAMGGVTRISLAGEDRIKEIVASDSNFEPKSNPETGDVFLRYIGKGNAPPEDGFIVTERGHTINYALKPKSTTSETVLVTLVVPKVAEAVDIAPTGLGAVSASDGHIPEITAFLRSVIISHVDGKSPPKRRSGTIIARAKQGKLRARVLVVRAGSGGGSIRPQAFYKNGVVSVFVDTPNLAPNARTFVIVVEQRS